MKSALFGQPRAILALIPLLLHSITSGYIVGHFDDFTYKCSGVFKPEMFYGKNVSLLNNNNPNDKIWFERHVADFKFYILYGNKLFGCDVVEFLFSLRNKAIWGNPNIAATTEGETKLLDAVARTHKHFIPRHIFWMREAWLKFDLSTILGIPFGGSHTFTLGAFPFQLGRGIALGSAFATGPELLGFYSESVVDQYAFGGKLSGDILPSALSYDLYAAVLRNKSSGLGETGAKVLGQEFGRLANPARGFGIINFLVAGRLKWNVFKNDRWGSLDFEPYAMYNSDPEQRVEFTGDAGSKLGTIGFAGEYVGNRCELGFDYALNLGQQRVKGWDRNQIIEENRDGRVSLVNSNVVDQNSRRVPFINGSDAQRIVNCSAQDENMNGQVIGAVDGNIGFVNGPITLSNNANRFRNPFTNRYEGWMFVIDGACWLYKKDLKGAVTAGISTGDENPNLETVDGVYSGFIPFQEIYSGKRVKSAFLLGGAGKLSRPLSAPALTNKQSPTRFAQAVDGFTDLVFVGGSLTWKPLGWRKKFSVMPNVVAFWKEKPTMSFDACTGQQIDQPASTYLGLEMNVFFDFWLLNDLKLFLVASLFVPGTHFEDIRGKPLNAEQARQLDRVDRTGFSADRIPNFGTNLAYTSNLGLEFTF